MGRLPDLTTPIHRLRLLNIYRDACHIGVDDGAKNLAREIGALLRVEDGWFTLPQAASYLAASPARVSALVKAGRIGRIRPDYGTLVTLVSVADCRKLLAQSIAKGRSLPGCDNPPLAQGKAGKKSKPKSAKR